MLTIITLLILWRVHLYCCGTLFRFQTLVVKASKDGNGIDHAEAMRATRAAFASWILNYASLAALIVYSALYIVGLFK